jgi:putative ABC transport system permease protein
VGRNMMLEGEPHLILGVLPDTKGETSSSDIYVPYVFTPETLATRNSRHLTALVRLKEGVSPRQAEAELTGLAALLGEAYPQTNKGWSFRLVPSAQELTGTSRQSLAMLAAAVGIVLLITCANLASLLLVRAAGRSREVAVRTALGARRVRIVRQMLTESVMLALVGGAAGLVLAHGTIRVVQALAPSNMPRLAAAHLDPATLGFTFALSLVTGLLFGIVPALHTLRVDLGSTLREESRGSSFGVGRSRLRSLLVISEVAMAAILLASAGLLVRSIMGLTRIELGFQPAGVLTARTTLADPRFPRREDRALYGERILERLKREPGITNASITLALPMMNVDWKAEFPTPGASAGSDPLKEIATYLTISPDYFATLGIPMKAGRIFTRRDSLGSPPVVIISEAFARRYYPSINPLGKSFQYKVGKEQITAEIVGVAGNAKHLKPDEPPRPAIYQPYAQLPWPFLAFAIRTERDPSAMIPAVRRAFLEVDSQQPIDRVMPLESLLESTLAQQKLAMVMLLVFAGLAILLASLGLYGLLAYSVAQRTREMGIRSALGASPSDVTLLVSGEGFLLTLAGAAAGLAVTPWAAYWFRDMLYDVKPWDPPTFLATAALLLAVAALACWGPARRAARLDPARALRSE